MLNLYQQKRAVSQVQLCPLVSTGVQDTLEVWCFQRCCSCSSLVIELTLLFYGLWPICPFWPLIPDSIWTLSSTWLPPTGGYGDCLFVVVSPGKYTSDQLFRKYSTCSPYGTNNHLKSFFFLHRFASSIQTVAQTTFAKATWSYNTSSAQGRNVGIIRTSMNHLPGVCVCLCMHAWMLFFLGGWGPHLINQSKLKDAWHLNHEQRAASWCHQGGRCFHHHTIQGGHRPGDHGDKQGRRSCTPGSHGYQTPRHSGLRLHCTHRVCE